MASLDLPAADAVLKQLYDYGRISDLCYQDNVFLGIVPKYEKFGGRNRVIPIRYGRPQGRSATFATAQSNATATKYTDFLITVGENFGVATIDGKTAEATRNDKHAFIDAITSEIDGIMREVSRDMNRNLHRTHTGAIGQVSAVSTTYVTLTNAADAHNFEVNMELIATADLSTARTGSATVTAVARNAATNHLTTDSNWTSQITDFAADDYLVQEGDLGSKMYGLQSWLPSTAPSSGDSYFGVDRSVDDRLYGVYKDLSSASSREDALLELQSYVATMGGKPDICLMNNVDLRKLIQDLGSKVQYDNTLMAQTGKGKSASIGFEAVVIQGDVGRIRCVADRDTPVGTAAMLELSSWELNSIGSSPHILNLDGLRIQRQSTSNGYEVRVGAYPQLACDAPGHNGRCALPTS